ncbi:hypothetical protein CBL_20663 [Carabus blaptoides fortunei]
MSRKEELSFNLGAMSKDKFNRAVDDIYVETILSDVDSVDEETDSDEEDVVQDPIHVFSDYDDQDSEDDLPLSMLKDRLLSTAFETPGTIQRVPPRWSTNPKASAPIDFNFPSGVPDFIKEMENVTPVKIFYLFITPEFKDHLVFQTNLYAEQLKLSQGKLYTGTNKMEIKAFLAINLLMGIKRSPSYRDYWSSTAELNDPFISSVMTMKTFGWLLSHLHVNNNADMPNRLSPAFDKLYKADKLLKRGDYQWYRSDSGLTAIKCKDKRTVHLLTNFHDSEVSTQVKRRKRDGNIHPIACPQLLVDYNNNKNGVDKFDQLLANYKVDRRSKKWWHRTFFYFLDASVINAYCNYKALEIPKIKLKDFRRSIINGLLSEMLVNKPKPPRTPLIEISNCKPFVPSEVRLESSKHQPVRGTRKRCALYSTISKQVRSEWMCSICRLPLCLSKNKSCFQDLHTNFI